MKGNLWNKLGDFVLGKGFYIVLTLCVATIGVSGYYLLRSASPQPVTEPVTEPVTGNPTVVLPGEEKTPVKKPASAVPVKPRQPKEQSGQSAQTAPTPAPQAQTTKPSAPVVYTWPVKGEVLRGMSVETLAYDPTMGDWRTHAGMDIAAEEGFSVLCISDGVVSQVREDDLMGVTVVVEHPEGLVSTYSNLAADPAVEAGEQVSTGTVLGTVGTTAIAESAMPAHLHLEMTNNGAAVDPVIYLPQK